QDGDDFGRSLVQLGLAAVGGLFEERVLLDFGADEVDQLEPRELQQLDRLLQLGGHHQLLAEAKVLLELERHLDVSPGYSSLNRSPRYKARARSDEASWTGVPASRSLPWTSSTARSQMPSVSRTAWSVTRIPRPRALSAPMRRCSSWTAMGSTPANGSSKSRNEGSVNSDRAISARRRSPPL